MAWRETWGLLWILLREHKLSEFFFPRIATTMEIPSSVPEDSSRATSMDEKLRYFLDADILDCPICTEPLSLPVYQCENGHCACSSCCRKLTKQRCPSCTEPTGRIRCMMVEKIIESLQVSCKHAPHGCKEMLQFSKRAALEEHEKETCKHKPLQCPHPLCMRKHEVPGPEFLSHLMSDHGVKTLQLGSSRRTTFKMASSNHLMMVKLDGDDDGIMLVHRKTGFFADEFFCSTVSGASQVYNLQVQRAGGPGRQSIYTIETSAPNIHKVVEESCNPKEGLQIPAATAYDLRNYEVTIRVLSPPPVDCKSHGLEAPFTPFRLARMRGL